jgi:hypothetical protein
MAEKAALQRRAAMAPATGSGHSSVIAGISSTGSNSAPTTMGVNVSVAPIKTGTITVGAANGRCQRCGDPLTAKRSTRFFCSDRCRKSAKRAEGYEPERRIIDLLRQRGLIGRVWPVYRSDRSPRVFALMSLRPVALAELNSVDPDITEDDLAGALCRLRIADWKQAVEADLIRRQAPRRQTEEVG